MDIQKYNEELFEAKSRLKDGDFVIAKPPVYSELGEEIYPGKVEVVEPKFKDIPYRTPLDLKGYQDGQVFTEPSMCDMTGYVDNREMIARLMKTLPASSLSKIAEQQSDDSDYTAEECLLNNDYEEFDETDEPLDNLTALSQSQIQSYAQAQDKPKSEQKQATEDEAEHSDNEDE